MKKSTVITPSFYFQPYTQSTHIKSKLHLRYFFAAFFLSLFIGLITLQTDNSNAQTININKHSQSGNQDEQAISSFYENMNDTERMQGIVYE